MKKTVKEVESKPVFSIKGMRVANVRKLSETIIAFSLLGNGLGLYNLKVVNGTKGKFIATPQTKGKKNGEWFNQYAVYLSEEDEQKIIAKVEALVPEDDEEE